MKKFMAIYMASGADFERMMKSSTPEQRSKGMEAWMKWMNENKASILEGGPRLGKTTRACATGVSDTTTATLSCKPKLMTQQRNCSVGTTHIFKCQVHGWKFSKSCRCRGCDPPVIRLLSHREGNRATGCASKHGRYGCRDATVSRVDVVPPGTRPSALRSLMNFAPFFPFDVRRVRHHLRRGAELPPARPHNVAP